MASHTPDLSLAVLLACAGRDGQACFTDKCDREKKRRGPLVFSRGACAWINSSVEYSEVFYFISSLGVFTLLILRPSDWTGIFLLSLPFPSRRCFDIPQLSIRLPYKSPFLARPILQSLHPSHRRCAEGGITLHYIGVCSIISAFFILI